MHKLITGANEIRMLLERKKMILISFESLSLYELGKFCKYKFVERLNICNVFLSFQQTIFFLEIIIIIILIVSKIIN